MTHPAFRVAASVLILIGFGGASYPQSPAVSLAINATPITVSPGGMLTVILTITNRTPSAIQIAGGILDVPTSEIVYASGPPGVTLKNYPSCAAYDCNPNFVG